MGEQTIEEAWEALKKHLGLRRHVEGEDWKYCLGYAEARALALAVLEEADMGFDDMVADAPKCDKCSWNSGPYSLPCEEHSQGNALRARIEALGR